MQLRDQFSDLADFVADNQSVSHKQGLITPRSFYNKPLSGYAKAYNNREQSELGQSILQPDDSRYDNSYNFSDRNELQLPSSNNLQVEKARSHKISPKPI